MLVMFSKAKIATPIHVMTNHSRLSKNRAAKLQHSIIPTNVFDNSQNLLQLLNRDLYFDRHFKFYFHSVCFHFFQSIHFTIQKLHYVQLQNKTTSSYLNFSINRSNNT